MACNLWHSIMECNLWHGIMACNLWHSIMECNLWHSIMACDLWHSIMACNLWHGIMACNFQHYIMACNFWHGIIECLAYKTGWLTISQSETESLLLRSNKWNQSFNQCHLSIENGMTSFSTTVKHLEFCLSDNTCLKAHVENTCSTAYTDIARICSKCHQVIIDATKTQRNQFFLPKQDCSNSLLL